MRGKINNCNAVFHPFLTCPLMIPVVKHLNLFSLTKADNFDRKLILFNKNIFHLILMTLSEICALQSSTNSYSN